MATTKTHVLCRLFGPAAIGNGAFGVNCEIYMPYHPCRLLVRSSFLIFIDISTKVHKDLHPVFITRVPRPCSFPLLPFLRCVIYINVATIRKLINLQISSGTAPTTGTYVEIEAQNVAGSNPVKDGILGTRFTPAGIGGKLLVFPPSFCLPALIIFSASYPVCYSICHTHSRPGA